MQKHNTSKDKTSSNQRHDARQQEDESRVHYEIINVDVTTGSKAMRKEGCGEGRTSSQRQNETALTRLKRKFKKKSSKSCDEAKNTGDSVNGQCDIASRSFANYRQKEHVYEVPFSSVEDSGEDEHIHQNGHVWDENNEAGRDSATGEDQKNKEIREGNALSHGNNWRLPQFQMDNPSSRNKEHWQQGKSMSLPASRVLTKHSGKSSVILPPSPSREKLGETTNTQSCDYSSNESSNEETIEPLPDHQEVNNSLLLRTRSLPVPSKLDFNHQFLIGLNDLCKRGWYWGPLTSKEAEVKLRGKPDGTYLVRDSNDNRYLLSLSFRSEMRTLHTRIEFCKGKFSFYAAPFITSGCHESIVELIEDCVEKSKDKVFCYSKGRGNNGAAFPVRLVKPISRFEYVCTLQHLCRFVIRQQFTLENISDMPLPGMMKRYLHKNHFDGKPF